MVGHEMIEGLGEDLVIAFGVGEGLDDGIDEGLEVVVFHVELLFELLVFLFEVVEVVFGVRDGVPELIGLIGDGDKVILEVVVLVVELENLLFEELYFLEEFFLFVFEVLLVSVVVDVFGEELLDMFLLF